MFPYVTDYPKQKEELSALGSATCFQSSLRNEEGEDVGHCEPSWQPQALGMSALWHLAAGARQGASTLHMRRCVPRPVPPAVPVREAVRQDALQVLGLLRQLRQLRQPVAVWPGEVQLSGQVLLGMGRVLRSSAERVVELQALVVF